MSVTKEEIAHAAELFSGLGDISTRRMMGGACLYHDGTIFAMLHSERGLMLKAQDGFIARMQELGQTQWTYERDGKARSMPYWSIPDAVLDDPDAAAALAREALEWL